MRCSVLRREKHSQCSNEVRSLPRIRDVFHEFCVICVRLSPVLKGSQKQYFRMWLRFRIFVPHHYNLRVMWRRWQCTVKTLSARLFQALFSSTGRVSRKGTRRALSKTSTGEQWLLTFDDGLSTGIITKKAILYTKAKLKLPRWCCLMVHSNANFSFSKANGLWQAKKSRKGAW